MDVGCGNGRSTAILNELCDEVVGIDFSEKLLKQASEKLKHEKKVRFYLEDAKKLHFNKDYFDAAVMMWNTFGNLYSNRNRVLREVMRIVKPGGIIFISVLSEDALPAYLELLGKNGLLLNGIDENYIFLKEGLISERFGAEKLLGIFESEGFNFEIGPLTEIGYWCRLKKNLS